MCLAVGSGSAWRRTCSEAFGNWGALSSEKSWTSFSMGDLIVFVLGTTEYCNVRTMLVQPVAMRLFVFSEQ